MHRRWAQGEGVAGWARGRPGNPTPGASHWLRWCNGGVSQTPNGNDANFKVRGHFLCENIEDAQVVCVLREERTETLLRDSH